MTRTACVAGAVAALGLLPPSVASAATASLVFDEPIPGVVEAAYALSVRAAPGETNRISVSNAPDAYTVTDTGPPLTPGPGCSAVAADQVRCPTPRAARDRSVFIDGRDGDDRLALGELTAGTVSEVRGGRGVDLIFGGAGNDLLVGGADSDTVVGGAGFDTLDGGPGDDALHGGDGIDAVSYEQRSDPVRVDLAAGTGGGTGEADTLTQVEKVVGGRGADDLRGSPDADALLGGEGPAHDRADGRGGDDVVIAYDALGGAGNDSVDGHLVSCGAGLDAIYRGIHGAPGPFPRTCELVSAIFVMLRAQPARVRPRSVDFAVRCKQAARCRGALELRDRHGVLGRRRFSLRRGSDPARLHRVRIRLSRRPVRRVATLRIDGVRAYQRSSFRARVR